MTINQLLYPWEFDAGATYQYDQYIKQGFRPKNIITRNANNAEEFNNIVHDYNNIASVTVLSHWSPKTLGASLSHPMVDSNNVSQITPITNEGGNMCVSTTVTLIACNTWAWENSIGQQMANQLDTTVVAPNAYVSVDPTYPGTLESIFWYRESGEPTLNNSGNTFSNWFTNSWKRFSPIN